MHGMVHQQLILITSAEFNKFSKESLELEKNLNKDKHLTTHIDICSASRFSYVITWTISTILVTIYILEGISATLRTRSIIFEIPLDAN